MVNLSQKMLERLWTTLNISISEREISEGGKFMKLMPPKDLGHIVHLGTWHDTTGTWHYSLTSMWHVLITSMH